jgi:hypothetical protein
MLKYVFNHVLEISHYYHRDCGIKSPLTGREIGFASLSDFVRGQYLRTWFVRVTLFRSRSEYLDCPRIFWSDVRFAFTVRFAFWFCALVIEGSALKLPQAFRERLDPKLSSLAFSPNFVETSTKLLTVH